ncbi:MAG: glycosyltransferase [Bacilli bacterium]|nr:glycosyltransferase [Bacilli bacterium]
MKKILYVFNHPAPYKVRFLNELNKHFDLTVIFERDSAGDRDPHFYSEKKYEFKRASIKGIKIGSENIISNGVVKHLKNNKYDLVIMNGYSTFAEMAAIRYLKKHNINYCFYINGGIIKDNESKFKRNLKTKYISGANFYMSPDLNSNKYLAHYGAYTDKIFNYPYSTIYEEEIIKKIPSLEEQIKLREEKGITAKEVYVSCGQLIPRKNYVNLVKAWPKNPDQLLIIIGSGHQKAEIERYIKENKISNILLVGYLSREEEFKYYHLADAFIFPSNEDIYGHVVNEALSQGLPVISTRHVNSSLKLIKEGENGLFINEITTQKVDECLAKIRGCKKEACIVTAKENTIQRMVDGHIHQFEQ